MQLTTGNTLNAKAGTITAITYTIMGDRKASGVDSYEVLGQGQLGTSAAAILTTSPVAASTQLLIATIELANTTASSVTGIIFYINGTAAANQVNGGFTVPANGSAVYGKGVWQIYASDGSIVTTVTVTLTGDVTGSGNSPITTTLRPGIARSVIGVTGNATGAEADIQGATDQVLRVNGAGTALAFGAIDLSKTAAAGGVLQAASMPALTGDVTTVAGALATTLASTIVAGGPTGSSSVVPVITYDAKGRLTTVTTATITAAAISAVPTSRTITATTPIQIDATTSADLSANRTLSIIPATTSLAGSMSALDKQKLDNLWIDVTANTTAVVLTTNTGAQNITAINAILSAAPNGSTIYFPPGIYLFNAAWTMPNKMFSFIGRGSNRAGSPATAFTDLRWNASVGGNLITIAGSGNGWYTTFTNLTFTAITADQASGAVISANGNVGVNITNCAFQSAGTFFFDVLSYDGGNGSNSGNSTVVSGCNIQGFKNVGIRCNASGSSLVVANTVIQGQWGTTAQTAAAGISGGFVGALQINDCDVLGSTNNLLLNPVLANSEVCASVFCTNTYFDFARGSCLKITGTGATVRCRFDTCSFTTSNDSTGFSAVEIASTFAYAAGGQGLDFVNCNILNTFATTGTTNGFLISGTADFSIGNCRVAGWTNGVQVTPIATAGRTQAQINNNTIGPAGGYPGNSVGILLNAGAATYGPVVIESNILTGNTSAPLTDNGLALLAGQQRSIQGNLGLASGSVSKIISTPTFTTVTPIALQTFPVPANGIRAGTTIRVILEASMAATGTVTMRLYYGANGTTADTQIYTLASPATVTAATVATHMATATFRSATTVLCNGHGWGGTTAVVGSANTATTAITSNVDSFLTVAALTSASTGTPVNLTIEVVQQ